MLKRVEKLKMVIYPFGSKKICGIKMFLFGKIESYLNCIYFTHLNEWLWNKREEYFLYFFYFRMNFDLLLLSHWPKDTKT